MHLVFIFLSFFSTAGSQASIFNLYDGCMPLQGQSGPYKNFDEILKLLPEDKGVKVQELNRSAGIGVFYIDNGGAVLIDNKDTCHYFLKLIPTTGLALKNIKTIKPLIILHNDIISCSQNDEFMKSKTCESLCNKPIVHPKILKHCKGSLER